MARRKFTRKQLVERSVSGAALAVGAILADVYGPLFGLMCIGIAGLALYEWLALVNKKQDPRDFTLIGVAVMVFPMLISSHMSIIIGMLGLGVLAVTCFLFLMQNFKPRKAFLIALGLIYIGVPMNALVWLRSDPESGFLLILYIFFVTWGSDTLAYFVGKTVGGRRLAPKISPKKTWSGFWGACGGAMIGGLIVFMIYHLTLDKDRIKDVTYFSLFGMGFWVVALVSFVAGAIGQVGDLMESYVKRYYDVKDSGTLIPGHGGILDRIDALLFIATFVAVAHFFIQVFYKMSVSSTML